MKKYLLLLALLLCLMYSCSDSLKKIDLNNFHPTEEFIPVIQALSKSNSTTSINYYDIEETVRILNALEIAQSQSSNFQEFLEYMARQDYTMVAKDVIQAKMRILPILQRMYQLEKEYNELSTIWVLAKSAATGAKTLVKESDTMGFGLAILNFVSGDFSSNNEASNIAKNAAFQQYEENMELKGQIKEEIAALEIAYLEYLSDYIPIYIKYMKEWDRLCLDKDKAYLDLYSGRNVDAYNSSNAILKKYPQNREALLLKSLSLINLSTKKESIGELKTLESQKEVVLPDSIISGFDQFLVEADITLEHYLDLYPNRSAPALVLKGILNNRIGNEQQALSFFDQAALEYPKQAKALTDLLDSYRNRAYLNKTPEGLYLLKLYRSTMEGYGLFSPNLLKAKYYEQKGMFQESKNEIFNHFFRRGNQGIYDCLLSDMQFCEAYLTKSFSQVLLEHSYIDINVKPVTDWKFTKKENEIEVTINNRSDIELENVRIFLCIHYTDMYKDEYDVVKVPLTKNIIKKYEKVNFGTVSLNYMDKKYQDITRIRAIGMTDDKICWIDDVNYKENRIKTTSLASLDKGELSKLSEVKESVDINSIIEQIRKNISLNLPISDKKKEHKKTIITKIKETGDSFIDLWNNSNDILKIDLPRNLILMEPIFSIFQIQDKEKCILPVDNFLTGNSIRLTFKYIPDEETIFPLYIYSKSVVLRIDVKRKGNKLIVDNIKTL